MALQVFIDERTPSSRQDAVSEAQLMHLDHFMWITYQPDRRTARNAWTPRVKPFKVERRHRGALGERSTHHAGWFASLESAESAARKVAERIESRTQVWIPEGQG